MCCFVVPVGDAVRVSPVGVLAFLLDDVACSCISAGINTGNSACIVVFLLILWVILELSCWTFFRSQSQEIQNEIAPITLVSAEDNAGIFISKFFEISSSGNDWASASGNAGVFAGRNAGISAD